MKKLTTIFIALAFFAFANIALAAKPAINVLSPSANDITTTSIRVTVSYQENGSDTEMMIQYTTDPGFGSGVVSIPSTFELTPTRNSGYFIKTITGLTPGMNYYIRAIATNNDGPITDPGIVVQTNSGNPTSTPQIETLGEESVTSSSLTLTGRVNTYGANGSAYFKLYNSGCSTLVTTTSATSLTATTGSQYIRTSVSGLNSNTTYCAELIANINGTNYPGGKVLVKTNPGSVTPTPTPTPNPTPTYPSCYYNSTCYWNGTTWVMYPVTPTPTPNPSPTYPSCYYNSTCYWNGTTWVYYSVNPTPNPNPSPTYPSCYYNATCYWNGTSWVYKNNTVLDNYSYNPHTPYTGGPNYVYKTLPGKVNTVYVDQQVQGQPINQVVTQPVDYTYYNNGYNGDIMNRYPNAYYDNTDLNNRVLLTGAAGNTGRITLIGLLIALIIIGIIVYFVRAGQKREIH